MIVMMIMMITMINKQTPYRSLCEDRSKGDTNDLILSFPNQLRLF